MTRKEAIEIFKRLKENAPNEMHLETVGTAQELFDMAIQALSQEPCDDAISREDRLIDLANAIESDDSGYWTNKRISSVLRNIPSVTQKCEKCAMNGSGSKYCDNCGQKSGKWIPVSERLPEENKIVIASTKYGVFPETKYTKEYGWEWAYEAGADYWRELEDVTAWMPLPVMYESQESEDKE